MASGGRTLLRLAQVGAVVGLWTIHFIFGLVRQKQITPSFHSEHADCVIGEVEDRRR